MQTTTLNEIENAAQTYARQRDRLTALAQRIQAKVDAIHQQYLPRLQAAQDAATGAETQLRTLIESAPELFHRPRTVIFHGIKLGFTKGRGGIEFTDPARVVQLIHQHYPGAAALRLLHVVERPDKEALNQLTVAELRKLGCEVLDVADHAVVRPVDDAPDRLAETLLQTATATTNNTTAPVAA